MCNILEGSGQKSEVMSATIDTLKVKGMQVKDIEVKEGHRS